MEAQGFEGEKTEANAKTLCEKDIPGRLKFLKNWIERETTKNPLLSEYKALEKRIEEASKKIIDLKSKSQKDTDAVTDSHMDIKAFKREHRKTCEKVLNLLGISDTEQRNQLVEVYKWDNVLELSEAWRNFEKEKETLANRITEIEKTLASKDKDLAESQVNPEGNRELSEKAVLLNNKKIENKAKLDRLNDINQARASMISGLKAPLDAENDIYKDINDTFSGRFASDVIFAKLNKLQEELAIPQKRGADSPEFTELKTALSNARRVFSCRAENWHDLSTADQKRAQEAVLDLLSGAAEKYLTEKDKEPHLWPFASTSGFQRRAIANDILSYCKSAQDMVNKAPITEYEMQKKIVEYKNPNDLWNENLKEQKFNDIMTDMCDRVNERIAEKPLVIENSNAKENVVISNL